MKKLYDTLEKMAQYFHDVAVIQIQPIHVNSLEIETYATWQRFDKLLSSHPA